MSNYLYYLCKALTNGDTQKAMKESFITTPLLDVGCGEGVLLEGPGIRHGIDNNKKGNSTKETIIEKDITEPWKLGRKYKTIMMSQVIEHFKPDDLRHIFREADKHLVDDGRVIITTPSKHTVWNTMDHIRPYTPSSLIEWFDSNHYKPVPDFELEYLFNFSPNSLIKGMNLIYNLLTQINFMYPTLHFMVFKK